MLTLTEFLHSTLGEISAIVCYNVVWKAKAEDRLLHELNRRCCITLAHWLCLYQFSELINRHQKVGLLILGPFKRPNHIKPPDRKGPSDWDHPQLLSRHMSPS